MNRRANIDQSRSSLNNQNLQIRRRLRRYRDALAMFVAVSLALSYVTIATMARAAPRMTGQTIADKVEDELRHDPGVTASKIDVSTTDGIVTLQGEVDNVLARQRAAHIAETISGVRSVVNRVQVRPSATMSDDEIRNHVESALQNDPATEAYEIKTSVADGKVMLSGTVDSYQERMLAVTVAQGVHGVTKVEQEIQVATAADRADDEIKSEIEEILKWNRFVDSNLVTVKVNDGAVELMGIVGSAAEKRQTQIQAWVAGVQSVDDSKLLVKMWARDEKLRGNKFALRTAQEIQSAITDALQTDPRVDSDNVHIEVAGSTVSLRGKVDNLKAKSAAESVARHTVGVTFVSNRLKVNPRNARSDKQIKAALHDAFFINPYVDRFEIKPTVISGTAFLYGDVDTQFAKYQARKVAEGVEGVREVKNFLRVNDPSVFLYDPYVDESYFEAAPRDQNLTRMLGKSDAQLKQSIQDQLWWTPFVNADDVTITVDQGVATLTGSVDSWAEQISATKAAYDSGVIFVDNEIEIMKQE